MRNEIYWAVRANRRMDKYTASAFDEARVIGRTYREVKKYVTTEMAKILRHIGGEGTLAYEYRMKRLNALLLNAEKKYQEAYGIVLNSATDFLKSIIPEAYYHTIFDIAQGIGAQPEFATINTRLINKIINEDWSGKNYSKRIWANTDKLAEDVREVLTTAAVTGESIYKTSKKVAEKFDTCAYNAERLIRTETTYATNQAELLAYNELDIDEYKFVATLDTRTSETCQKLDGKVFKVKDAQAGKNLPAMHPNCRSTTIPYFKEGMPTERIAKDKDGKRIKVPADMTYPEWHKKYIELYEKEKKPKTKSASTRGKSVESPASKPAEITISKPERPKNAYSEEKINKKSLDNSSINGIIKEKEELPRKPKSGVNLVDWNTVQSKEYSDKFRKLSEDEKVSAAIETRAKWALNNRDGKKSEELYAISLKNGQEIARITDQNNEYAVQRTPEFTRKLNNADKSGESIILLHNHPRGLPPGLSDINALTKNENVSGITIGHNGSIYRYTRPEKEITKSDWAIALRRYKEYSDVTSMEKALADLSKDYKFVFEIL